MSASSSIDPLADAHTLCKNHGLFIVESSDRIYDRRELRHRQVTVWVLYRKSAGGGRGVRLGKRRDPGKLLRFVRRHL